MMLNKLSLNTIGLNRIGLNRIGRPSVGSSGSRPYIDPEVLASLVGVWECDGKTNYDPDRNIIKNKIKNAGGDFEILNASYEEGSGYKDGAFVSDGVDDIIVSQKPIQEMLGGSNEITVVSMIHQIGLNDTLNKGYTNVIEGIDDYASYLRNTALQLDKTGIYGYTYNGSTQTLINNILGDKNDYEKQIGNNFNVLKNSRFSVAGGINNKNYYSKVAWYWTIIAKKVLTTDQINQVIAYFNLDKHVEPIVYYDVPKQGLTNDTPLADWYLKDYSKNGWDMSLYNFAKSLNSGIGIWGADYTKWTKIAGVNATSTKITIDKGFNKASWLCYLPAGNSVPTYKVRISGVPDGTFLVYGTTRLTNGVWDLPAMETTSAYGFRTDYAVDWSSLVIEQIPDYEGGIVFDGVNDYGQLVQELGLKDYTVVADRAYQELSVNQVPIISAVGAVATDTPFTFEFPGQLIDRIIPYSFGSSKNILQPIDVNRKISYQSAYVYNAVDIIRGTSTNVGDGLTFGRYGVSVQYAKLVLWRFLLFKYSMSEFLIERQLKKFKAGTLYPDMIEWRPIVKSNADYEYIRFYIGGASAVNGQYYTSQLVSVQIKPNGTDVPSVKINGVSLKLGDIYNGIYRFVYTLDKSPQKVDITIDEYIRYEDIVQPYPAIVNLKQDGQYISWGDRLKVGSEVTFVNHSNLLPELYTAGGGIQYNGTAIYGNTPIIVEKSMVFANIHTWKLNTPEPLAILSPQKLRIPNDSYYSNMSLYEFMLFPEIPEEDEIKSLNDSMGIEGNTDDLFNKTINENL